MDSACLELFSQRPRPGAAALGDALAAISYREMPPHPAAQPLVACTWATSVPPGRPYRLRIVPDGCADVVFGGPAGPLVFGPRTGWHEVELPAGSAFAGVRIRPHALAAALCEDARELAGRIELLGDVSPTAVRGARPVAGSCEAFLASLRDRVSALDPVVTEAVEVLANPARPRVADLAAHLRITERTLSRRFSTAVGLPPASYRRIARFRQLLLACDEDDVSWARLAGELGYADQAHLVREYRTMTGTTPAAAAAGGHVAERAR